MVVGDEEVGRRRKGENKEGERKVEKANHPETKIERKKTKHNRNKKGNR